MGRTLYNNTFFFVVVVFFALFAVSATVGFGLLAGYSFGLVGQPSDSQ
jgi:hypothetical protein